MFLSAQRNSRREFLGRMGVGLGGVALAALGGRGEGVRSMEARVGERVRRARSVIFLFMVGGPSSVDSFDYKPVLQGLGGKPTPAGLRAAVERTRFANVFHGCKDELMASPFGFRRYGQTGLWVSELFPSMARHVDEFCVIHSMQADSNNHGPASYQLHTGDIRPGKASLGSWVTYGLGTENQNLPGYVMLFEAGPLGGAANYSNGFLPASFQPTRLRDEGAPVLNLNPPAEFVAGHGETMELIREMNREHLGREGAGGDGSELEARIASYELAYRMQAEAMEVGEMEREPAWLRREYGLESKELRAVRFGRKCLMARRLVERGVRFVQVYDMPDKDGWDAHDKLSQNHVPRARWTDGAVGALISDLKSRGMLESTLVIWASEFGRTPMMQGNEGRQHNAAGFTIWMAGGGVRAGARVGATDEIGLMAVEQPCGIRDLHATILAALGLEHERLEFEVEGRRERLTGIAGGAGVIPGVLG